MDTFRLRTPPFWTRGIFLALLVLAVVVGLATDDLGQTNLLQGLALAVVSLGAYLTGAGLILAVRLLRLPRTPPEIRIGEDLLDLPIKADSRRSMRVPFRDLKAVELRVSLPAGFLIIETTHRTFLYRVQDFEHPEDLLRFGAVLRDRLAAHPEGNAILTGLAIESERMRAAIARPTHVTHAIAATLAVVFVLQIVFEAFPENHMAIFLRMGSGQGILVRHGEAFRLITANLLHGGLFHFGVNLVGLFLLGGLVERVLGPWRLLLLYLVAGLTGAAASAFFFPEKLSVGASGCLFGLLGGYGVVSLRFHDSLPGGFRVHLRSWVLVLGLNAALPIVFPSIDWVAHVGGLAGGALTALACARTRDAIEPQAPTPGWIRTAALLLLTLWIAGTAAGVRAALQGDLSATIEMARDAASDPELANGIAWDLCITPNTGRYALHQATTLAEVAVERSGRQPHIRDTLAQCLHRLGRDREAVQEEADVVEASLGAPHASVYATQLGRFARDISEDPMPPLGVEIASSPGGVRLSAEAHETSLLLWYEVRSPSSGPTGMLRVCLGVGAIPEETRLPVGSPSGPSPWPANARFLLRAVESDRCKPPASGWSVYFFPPDPEAKDLP